MNKLQGVRLRKSIELFQTSQCIMGVLMGIGFLIRAKSDFDKVKSRFYEPCRLHFPFMKTLIKHPVAIEAKTVNAVNIPTYTHPK
jgi:hypothetical protein